MDYFAIILQNGRKIKRPAVCLELVRINGDRIQAIEPLPDTFSAEGHDVVDARDEVVIPGFVNAHVPHRDPAAKPAGPASLRAVAFQWAEHKRDPEVVERERAAEVTAKRPRPWRGDKLQPVAARHGAFPVPAPPPLSPN